MNPTGKPKTGRPKKGSYREGRDRKLCIRVDKATLRKLDILSKHYGITKSDYLISEIGMAFDRINGYPN